jgi:PPM family protein phosphatase
MNLFRRLFSQSASDSEQTDTTMPAVQITRDSSAEIGRVTKPLDGEVQFLNLTEGATRELPPDIIIAPPAVTSNQLNLGYGTDVGAIRSINQDAVYTFLATPRSIDDMPDFGVFIVADGMGGHHDGEKASAAAMRVAATQIMKNIYVPMLAGESVNQTPITETLIATVEKANAEVVAKVPDGGTTLSMVVLIGGMAYIAHVGDSRIYLITRDSIEQITRDHSLVQRLIELGQLTQEEANNSNQSHMLYKALGQTETVEVDTLARRLPPRSKLLLCSDGLWNQVSDRDILEIIKQYPNPQDACNKLIATANMRGGIDNVTVVLLNLPG